MVNTVTELPRAHFKFCLPSVTILVYVPSACFPLLEQTNTKPLSLANLISDLKKYSVTHLICIKLVIFRPQDWSHANMQPLHMRCHKLAQTEIIRAITPTSEAYLLKIGLKNALCSLIGSVGCCNPSTQLVLISLVQTVQLDMHLSYLSERRDTAVRA